MALSGKLWTTLCGRLVATVFGHCGRLYLTLQGTAVVAANRRIGLTPLVSRHELLQNRLELGQNLSDSWLEAILLKSLTFIIDRRQSF